MWKKRLRKEATVNSQRCWRGGVGRTIFFVKKAALIYFLQNAPSALNIQRCVRGHLTRLHTPKVARAMRELYVNRNREAEAGIAVRFQSFGRRYLARRRMLAWKEVKSRRNIDEANAVLIMQQLARAFLAVKHVRMLRFQKARRFELETRAAKKIQAFYFRYACMCVCTCVRV